METVQFLKVVQKLKHVNVVTHTPVWETIRKLHLCAQCHKMGAQIWRSRTRAMAKR